ncbi:MAG: rhomboid family intramembrane serine protease [Sphingobium sp.]
MRAVEAKAVSIITAVTGLAFLLADIAGWVDILAYVGGFIPARVAHPGLLDHAGLPIPALPMVLTPLSATLLHGNWMHLAFNLVIFLFCGRQVESVLGTRLLVTLYVVGAYAAAAGQWLIGPDLAIPMIGASGAISAIIGAYALLFGNQKVRSIGPIPATVVRMAWLGAGWIFLQFLIGVATRSGGMGLGDDGGGVAIGAHIGGFVAGMLLTRPLLRLRYRRR